MKVRVGVVSCLALVLLTACGGGSRGSSTSTSLNTTATSDAITSTFIATAEATPTASPPATPLPTATPRLTATPRPTVTPRPTATPRATPAATPVASNATPVPTDKVQAQLAKNVTSDYQPVDPTTDFSTDTAKIYLVFSTADLPANSTLDTVWIAVKVSADVPPNYEIDRAHLDVHGSQNGDFSLTSPSGGFPVGSYKVDLYLNRTLIGSYPFTVK